MNLDYPSYDDLLQPDETRFNDHGVARDILAIILEYDAKGTDDEEYRVCRIEDQLEGTSTDRLLRIILESDPWRVPCWPSEKIEDWEIVDHSDWFELENVHGDGAERVSVTPAGREAARKDTWRDPPLPTPDNQAEASTEVVARGD